MNNLSSKQQENALNQVRILASVKCPYIVGYKHIFVESNSLCIVMQFFDDGDLYQKIVTKQKTNTFFEEEQIWKVLIQAVMGLKNLHQMNIFHQNIKSANVFLSKDDVAKLADMNVSEITKNELLLFQTGPPYYASPQLWRNQPYNAKSDIWSLGCVIYEMVTLKLPFLAQNMIGLYQRIIKGSYQHISDNFSKALSSVIKSMLQVNPANRPSASQLFIYLEHKAEQYGFIINSQPQQLNKTLQQTLRSNKNLHYLTDKLPKSNDANGNEYEQNPKQNQSTKTINSKDAVMVIFPNLSKNLVIPKLGRVNGKYQVPISYQHPKDKNDDKKHTDTDLNILLKKSERSNKKNGKKSQQSKDLIQKDLKAQIRKIYRIKPFPSNHERQLKPIYQNFQLSKIN